MLLHISLNSLRMSLRVLLVSTGVLPLPPETSAGAEYHIYYLANYLAKQGVEVHLVSEVKFRDSFHPNVVVHSFRFRHPPLRRFTGWLLTHTIGGLHSFIKYLEVVSKVSPDIIHIHGRLAARLISIFRNKPLVYTLHDQSPFTGAFRGLERMIRIAAYLAQEYRVVHKVDHVIAVSRHIYRELIQWIGLPVDKVSYIPNGVDVDYFKPARCKKPYILFVGRLTKRKGVDLLVKAFTKIATEYKDLKLVIVGDGEEKKMLQTLIEKLGVRSRVRILGNVSRHTLKKLYAEASIFVLPSRGEGLPLSLLEAMASECAVVATRVSGAIDVIKHGYTGLLISPNNVEELASTIETLIADESLRKKLALRARDLVLKEYSWDRVAEKTLAVYHRVGSCIDRKGRWMLR